MDDIKELIQEIISEQSSILSDIQHNATEASERAASYSALAANLEAERIAVQKWFEQNQEEKVRLYKSANGVLDEAIKAGNTILAAIALRVIELAHTKTLFV